MGAIGNTLDPSNHDSPIGALMEPIQKYTDPLSWVTGGKWADLTSKDIPKWTNEALSPITQGLGQIDKTINPLRKIPIIDQIGNVAEAKPGDAIGLVVGSIFSGGALDGALAGSGGAAGAGAGAAGAADAGTAAAVGAGAADAGTAVGLGSGLLAGTAGTDLGAGTLAATMGTTVGATGSIGAAGGFSALGAGAGAASTFGPTSVGVTGVGNGIGSALGAGAGQAGTGTYGALNGAAAYGDSGLASTVGTSGGFAMPTSYGSALGDAPTGLYSGLLPGGGMSATSSGALGGGMSGAVDGTGAIGYGTGAGSTMGGFFNSPALSTASKWISAAQKVNSAGNLANAAANGERQQAVSQPTMRTPAAGRGVRNAMPTPAALPMMSNPGTSMMAMPGANALPTSTSSYQALLQNMLGNSQNPMTGLGSSTSQMPGAGGPMNPGYLIPGMY